jgi:hypothetical protein
MDSFAIALMVCAASSAAAQDGMSSENASGSERVTFDLGVGAHLGLAQGSSCLGTASELTCHAGDTFAGLRLGPRWRLHSAWSLGGLATASSAIGSSDSTTWWTLSADGRWHPFGRASADLWLGFDAGFVSRFDDLEFDGFGRAQYTAFAPALGSSVGVELGTASAVAMAVDLRGFVYVFGGDPHFDRIMPGAEYATQAGAILTLAGIVHAGR